MQQQLAEGAAAPDRALNAKSVGVLLAGAAASFQTCIAQVGEMFLPANGGLGSVGQAGAVTAGVELGADALSDGQLNLLQAALHEEESDVSELFFGAAYGMGEGMACPEVMAWQAEREQLAARLEPLARTQVGGKGRGQGGGGQGVAR
jgi:hypothetical protein